MLTPASSAMPFVLKPSKLSLTRMRAVASISTSTVARERACEACFRGFVSGLGAICRGPNASSQMRAIAHIMHPRTEIATEQDRRHDSALLPTHCHQAMGRSRPIRSGQPEFRPAHERGRRDHAAHTRPYPYGRQDLSASPAGGAAFVSGAPLGETA